MKKRIITAFLTLVFILISLQVVSLASFEDGDHVQPGQSVNIAFQETVLNYMTLNGSVRGFKYTYFWFLTKDGVREQHPVYCMAPDERGAFEVVRDDGPTGDGPNTARYVTGERITRMDYVRIMEAGYPHNALSSIGVNSNEEGYYATKIALWMVILGITPDSGRVGANLSHPDQAAVQRVYNAAINIYRTAQGNMWGTVSDPKIEIPAPTAANSWHLTTDSQWYEMSIQIKTNKYIGTNPNQSDEVQLSWDTSTGAIPEGIVVLNGSSNITATMKPLPANGRQEGGWYVQPITIRVPAQVVDDYFNDPANRDVSTFPMPTLKAFAKDMNANNFYVATYAHGSAQPYLIEADRKADVLNTFQTVIPRIPNLEEDPLEMGLKIIKLQSGTLIPLPGAVIEIYNPRGQLIGSYATDANGEINVQLGEAGLYSIKETVPPQYHILPTHTSQQVQVNIGAVTSVTITNEPYGALRIQKRDAANGRPLGGASIQIKHIESGVTFSAITDTSGTVEFLNLPVGGYEIRELISPTGYALDTGVHTVAVRPLTQGVTSYTLPNLANPGLRIIKLDRANSIPIAGVVFEIWHGGALFGEYRTNFAGEILLTNLPAGTYIAREKSTVEPYVLDPTTQWVEIRAGQGYISELVFLNVEKPGIHLVKLDSNTMQPLANAIFVIKMVGGSFMQEFTTDVNGEVDLTALEPGAFTVEEIKAPTGYLIDNGVRTVQINPGENAVFVFTNTKKPSVIVRKYDEQTAMPLPDTEFSIATKGGTVIYEGLTNSEGFIRLDNLEEGWYTVTEMAPPPGYLPSMPSSRDVYLFGGAVIEVKFDNPRCPTLTVNKVDRDTLAPLSGVRFNVKFSPNINLTGGVIDLGDFVTDASGRIVLSDDLKSGWYRITELAPPPGYVTGVPEFRDIFLAGGEDKAVVFENIRKPSLIVWKYDEQTASPLPDTEFSITHKGGHVIYEGLTNSEGFIRLDGLDVGWYTVTEMAPPPGYLNSTPASRDVYLEAGKTVEIKFDNLRCPTLTVLKLDSITHDPIKNVRFNVRFSPYVNFTGGVTDLGNYMTDEQGRILLDNNLQSGWYRVTELEPAPGYIMKEPVVQEIFLRGGDEKTLTFENIPRSALIIRKIGNDGLPIQGATFTVRYLAGTSGSGGTLIKAAVTSVNGTITVTGLAPGTYVVEETIPAPGHQLANPVVQTAYISDSDQCVVELVFSNPKMGRLVIEKRSSAANHLPVAGVTFRVTDSSGAVIGPNNGLYTTDVTGIIVIDEWLPIGSTVIVTEISGPEDYNLDAPPQTIRIQEGATHTLTFYNSPKSGLQIIKTESGSKTPLKDAHFRVIRANGEVVGDYVTDADGLIIVPNLEPGWYKAYETRAPDGYLADDTPKDFQITGNQFVRLEFENRLLSGLLIVKYDSTDRSKALAGAVFSITDSSGRFVGNANGRFTTDRQGRILVSGLPLGTYIVTEVSAPPGYKLDGTPQTIMINAGEGLYSLSFYDEPLGGLQILKIDEDTRRPIPNVEFMIAKMNGERLSANTYITDAWGNIYIYGLEDGWYTVTEVKAADGYILDAAPRNIEIRNGTATPLRITNKKASSLMIEKTDSVTGRGIYGVTFILYDSGRNPIMQLITDQYGYAYVRNELTAGRYYLRELEPAEGYERDDEWKTIYIEAGRTTHVEWKNKPITGQIQILKYSSDYNSVTGTPAGSLLPGAVFEITRARSGAVVGYITTDARGVAASDPLPLGRYYVREVTAPQYYQLSGDRMEAELEYAGQIIRLSAYNRSANLGTEIKKVGNIEVIAGDSMRYDLSISNTSNVPLSEFYWADRLPTDAVRAQSLTTGTYNQRLYYRIVYKTNYSDWRVLASNLLSTNNYSYNLSAAALGLAGGEVVTNIRFEFGTVAAGFANVTKPTITVQTLPTLASGYRIINRAEVGGKYGGAPEISTTEWLTIVVKFGPDPRPDLPKTGH